MLKIGMSSCAFSLNDENTYKQLAEAGVRNIEMSLAYRKLSEYDFNLTKKYADFYDINIWSLHLPFSSPTNLDIASTDEDLRLNTLELWSGLIKKGGDIGINKFVVHPSSEPKSTDKELRDYEISQSMKSLRTLADVAGENGGVIAVEDLPRTCLGNSSEEMLKLVSVDPRLRICFDTNHILGEDLYLFIDKIAHKIITVHVSDYDFINERHWLPGEGDIDWKKLYKKLTDSGYRGVWMYELGLNSQKTITRDRAFTYSDFVRNANEIFNGEELTVIGKRNENLEL